MSLLEKLTSLKKAGKKSFAVLLDPDNLNAESARKIGHYAVESKVDFFFIGGSLLINEAFNEIIALIKSETSIPVIIFPGSNLQISSQADALLFLSLISGRNPEYLIGQHVVAAPLLKRSNLEVLSTGYILIDCGKPTTASYMSNTTPIPYDKPAVAACTALAGEMLGLKLIYLDGGSGAMKPISTEMIAEVCATVKTPIIVGGGINTPEEAKCALKAGADLIVVGNALEKNPSLLVEIAECVEQENNRVNAAR